MSRILKALLIALGAVLVLPANADDMPGMGMTMTSEKMGHGVGVIKAIDTKQGTITLDHQAIKELNWPAMTMAFKVADPKLLTGRTVGEKVDFGWKGNDKSPVVTSILPAK
jgi:Cu/Ag efflux protein CusF